MSAANRSTSLRVSPGLVTSRRVASANWSAARHGANSASLICTASRDLNASMIASAARPGGYASTRYRSPRACPSNCPGWPVTCTTRWSCGDIPRSRHHSVNCTRVPATTNNRSTGGCDGSVSIREDSAVRYESQPIVTVSPTSRTTGTWCLGCSPVSARWHGPHSGRSRVPPDGSGCRSVVVARASHTWPGSGPQTWAHVEPCAGQCFAASNSGSVAAPPEGTVCCGAKHASICSSVGLRRDSAKGCSEHRQRCVR